MPRKTDFQLGLETILNNPATSFLKNPVTFNEIHKQSAMPVASMIRQVGKGSRGQNGKARKEPTDEERSKARLETMESKTEK